MLNKLRAAACDLLPDCEQAANAHMTIVGKVKNVLGKNQQEGEVEKGQ